MNTSPVEPSLIAALKKLSLDAYKACGGKGYTRIDIRQDATTGKLYMLEVNAQCGLSEDEDYTSIGAILKASDVIFTEVITEILKDALRRSVMRSIPVKKIRATKYLQRLLRLNNIAGIGVTVSYTLLIP